MRATTNRKCLCTFTTTSTALQVINRSRHTPKLELTGVRVELTEPQLRLSRMNRSRQRPKLELSGVHLELTGRQMRLSRINRSRQTPSAPAAPAAPAPAPPTATIKNTSPSQRSYRQGHLPSPCKNGSPIYFKGSKGSARGQPDFLSGCLRALRDGVTATRRQAALGI